MYPAVLFAVFVLFFLVAGLHWVRDWAGRKYGKNRALEKQQQRLSTGSNFRRR